MVADYGFAPDKERFQGLDLLATAVLVLNWRGIVVFANQAAEQLFEISRAKLVGQQAQRLFSGDQPVDQLLADAEANALGQRRQILELRRAMREPLLVQATASALYSRETPLVIELAEIEQQLKVSREERQLDLTEANRQLLRNLAHEIKNPLGGIRGAAQLLEDELGSPEQREYTRVIIDEADRLQSLVDRLLAPHRTPRVVTRFNVHEVFERVRTVISAEFPRGLQFVRDYDASVPDIVADREQLIQAVLNVVRNAAEALEASIAAGDAQIVLRTRVARHVTIARRHVRLALDLHVIDNGPGIPEELRDRIFYPLVSGREGGSGLGLTLAQTLVQQNDGVIEVESRPGRTDFRILLPLS
jgi:two-component system, NtrC family, nitrogen regulation sensor histidine kinase GlnL